MVIPEIEHAGLAPRSSTPALLPGLSVVLACRDDERTVADAVRRAAAAAAATSLEYEIVAVDDGSRDQTPEILAGLAAHEPRLRVLLHTHPRGRTEALATAIASSRLAWVLLLDAADEIDLDRFEDFLLLAADHDLLLGRRVMRRGPVTARMLGVARSRAASRIAGVEIHDVDCPLTLVRHELLDGGLLGSYGWPSAGLELVQAAHDRGGRVAEVNVRQRREPRGAASTPRLKARELGRLVAVALALEGRGRERPGELRPPRPSGGRDGHGHRPPRKAHLAPVASQDGAPAQLDGPR
jgi:hypothetical protein